MTDLIDTPDRDAVYAAMYGKMEPEKKTDVHIVDPAGFNRTRKIIVGAIPYEVPTVAYVARLEQIVMRQNILIRRLEQEMNAMQKFVNGTRKFIKGQTKHINEIQHELDNKIDARE